MKQFLIYIFVLAVALCVSALIIRGIVNSDMPLWLKVMLLR